MKFKILMFKRSAFINYRSGNHFCLCKSDAQNLNAIGMSHIVTAGANPGKEQSKENT